MPKFYPAKEFTHIRLYEKALSLCLTTHGLNNFDNLGEGKRLE